jgi:hypothetical protein
MRPLIIIILAVLFAFLFARFAGDAPVKQEDDTSPVVEPAPGDNTDNNNDDVVVVEEEETPSPVVEDDDAAPSTPPPALPEGWHFPPGDLLDGSSRTRSSTGVEDASVVSPTMRFPIEKGPAFPNSQIFGRGGGGYASGAWPAVPGSENDAANFTYPWRDDFCEVRFGYDTELCPGGEGHLGQDIRAATCENAVHWAVAPEDGYISHIGSISVNVFGAESGFIYKFLHIQAPLPEGIVIGAPVTKGQRIARVSDRLKATSRATTVHIHFEMWGAAEVNGVNTGVAALPPYSSLVEAYMDLMEANPDQIAPVAQPSDITDCTSPQWP